MICNFIESSTIEICQNSVLRLLDSFFFPISSIFPIRTSSVSNPQVYVFYVCMMPCSETVQINYVQNSKILESETFCQCCLWGKSLNRKLKLQNSRIVDWSQNSTPKSPIYILNLYILAVLHVVLFQVPQSALNEALDTGHIS